MNTDRALDILQQLIQIESVNPHYGADASGEHSISVYVEQFCRNAGLIVTRQPVLPGRDNIIAELRIGKPHNTLLLEAHMDTVSVGAMEQPFVPRIEGDRLYGRGACDTKGSLAAMLCALEHCAQNPQQLPADIVLCAAVDEEHAFRGLSAFLDLNMKVAGAVVGEPTELNIVTAHKGCVRFAIHTSGLAAHTSMPEEGRNAIYPMIDLVRFIREQIEPELAQRVHPLCGAPTITVSTIAGGEQINIVPSQCTVTIDYRTTPDEHEEQVFQLLKERLYTFSASFGFQCDVEPLLLDKPLNTALDSQIVQTAAAASRELQLSPQPVGVPYGSDASKLQHIQRTPAIVFGPGSIRQAHTAEEWVSVRQVRAAAQWYALLARHFGESR